jgi:hypothetical protein
MRRPLMPVAAAALVATLLCAGCSRSGTGSDDRSDAASFSAEHGSAVRAAVVAVRQDTARIDQKIEITGDGTAYTLTVTGGFDFARDRGHIAVDLPGGAVSHSEETFADDKIYIDGSHGATEGEWGVMPRDKAEAHYVLRAPLNDPEHALKQLSAMRQVSREGEERVHGVRTVHYRGMFDHGTLTSRMAQAVRKKTDQARDLLGSDLPVFADVWVDGQGRIAQARTMLNMSGLRVTVTTNLSDFGKLVRVTAPKAEDTLPLTAATGVLNG